MSRLRFQPNEWTAHFVTQRNLMGYLLMKPTKRLNLIIAGCLARSVIRYQSVIKLHAYVFLSNHYHMIISSKNQRDLSAFMAHFNGCLGKELAIYHDFHGKIWHKRYRSSPILDEVALEDRYRYLLAHSMKEDLVNHPMDWPGLHAYKQLCAHQKCEGIWVDRTALYHARQRAQRKCHQGEDPPTEADFTSTLLLELAGSPALWPDLTEDEYLTKIKKIASEVIKEHRERRLKSGKRALGVKKVLSQPIFTARFTKRTPCPLCHTRIVSLMHEFKRAYYNFVAQFRQASYELRLALALGEPAPPVSFPEGGVPLFSGD